MANVTFRLVANFQYKENYGSHDWNGQGECPQYWKFKGGETVIVLDGVTLEEKGPEYIALVKQTLAEEIAKHCWRNEYSQQYLLGFEWEASGSWTEQEEIDAYMDWHEELYNEEIFEEDNLEPEDAHYFEMAAFLGHQEYA